MLNTSDRHPATQGLARWLTANPNLPIGPAQGVALECEALAMQMISAIADGPELTAGLRHLLEAKDCFVRAAIGDS